MESVIGEVLLDKILAHVGMEGVVVFDNDGLDGLVGGARSRVLGGWGARHPSQSTTRVSNGMGYFCLNS